MDEDLTIPEFLDDQPSRTSRTAQNDNSPLLKYQMQPEGKQILRYAELRQRYMENSIPDLDAVSFNLEENHIITGGQLNEISESNSDQESSRSFISSSESDSTSDEQFLMDCNKGFSPYQSTEQLLRREVTDTLATQAHSEYVFKCPPPLSLRSKVKLDWTYGYVNGPLLQYGQIHADDS